MKQPERQYKNEEVVIAGYQRLRMRVVDATFCVKGWRYQLAFMKHDGTMDKRRKYRFFFENDLSKPTTHE